MSRFFSFLVLLMMTSMPFANDLDHYRSFISDEPADQPWAATVTEFQEDQDLVYWTVELPYLDIYGNPATTHARLIARPADLDSQKKLPVFCHVHYEKNIGGARKWARRGWAVATIHWKDITEYPSPGNSNNANRAMIQWVRRLPFIDRTHLHIDGASQGGYMALAMSADFFPVASTTAGVPVVNWAYNLNYFEANKKPAKYPADFRNTPLPGVCSTIQLVDWCTRIFGDDLNSDTWYRLSPIAWVDRITNPVAVNCFTGDMLVPIPQITQEYEYPIDPTQFPEAYTRDFNDLTLNPKSQKTLVDCLPSKKLWIKALPVQRNSFIITLDYFLDGSTKPGLRPENLDQPWSRDHQWSICIGNEGRPTPFAFHTTYEWSMSPDSFTAHHQQADLGLELLTPVKLDRLLQRYRGELQDLPFFPGGESINRLNFAAVEKLDVLVGLLDYGQLGATHEKRLAELYSEAEHKPLGAVIPLASLRGAVSEQRLAMGLAR